MIPTEGLTAHYPLNGTAQDESGNGYHGKVVGATPTQDRFGQDGQALRFDGVDDEIVISTPPRLTRKGLAISLWASFDFPEKHTSWTDIGDGAPRCHDPLIGQDDGYSIRVFQLWMLDRKLLWHRLCEHHSVWTEWQLEPGKWYHVVAMFDGNEHHLFVDGKKEGTSAAGILKACRCEPVRIGSKGDETGWPKRAFFSGALDEIRLYNRPLNQQEVQALFAERAGISRPDVCGKSTVFPEPR